MTIDRMGADWIVETSSTTGTGTYTLGGPPAGTSYFPFRGRITTADPVRVYYVRNKDRTKWEKNRSTWPSTVCTLTWGASVGTDTLTRNVVQSTSGDGPISWTSGDLPLTIYIAPDLDLEDFIAAPIASARPAFLRVGLWAKSSTPASAYHRLTWQDGAGDSGDTPVGVVNETNHEVTLYAAPPTYLQRTLVRASTSQIDITFDCMDTTKAVRMRRSTTLSKDTGGAWVAGGGHGMGSALTIATNTWYAVHGIIKDGVADAYFDTSITAANKPSGTSYARCLGFFRTDGSSQIIDFVQVSNNTFLFKVPRNSYTATGTGATFVASVPVGLRLQAKVRALGTVGSAGARNIVLYSPDQTAMTPNTPAGNVDISWGPADQQGACCKDVWTDASGQIVITADSTTALSVATEGWIHSGEML